MIYYNEQYLSSYSSPSPLQFFFSAPLLPLHPSFFSPDIVCRNHLAPVINRGLKSRGLSLINQAPLSWGIVEKVSDSCFVFRHSKISFALKKHLRGRQPVEIEFPMSGRKNAKKKPKNIFMKFCARLSCFRLCPSFYPV